MQHEVKYDKIKFIKDEYLIYKIHLRNLAWKMGK